MNNKAVQEKSLLLGFAIVKQVEVMESNHEYVISKQLLRAGTSVGANICESSGAESRKDFNHKLQIALKEAYECEYWIKLIEITKYKKVPVNPGLKQLLTEVLKLLVSITKTLSHPS